MALLGGIITAGLIAVVATELLGGIVDIDRDLTQQWIWIAAGVVFTPFMAGHAAPFVVKALGPNRQR